MRATRGNAFRLAAARAKKQLKFKANRTFMEELELIASDLYLPPAKPRMFKGIILDLYEISYVAAALGRTNECIRQWERDKIIPPATFRDKRQRRLYHPLQIALLVYLVDKHKVNQGRPIKPEFVAELHQLWDQVKKYILDHKNAKDRKEETTSAQ